MLIRYVGRRAIHGSHSHGRSTNHTQDYFRWSQMDEKAEEFLLVWVEIWNCEIFSVFIALGVIIATSFVGAVVIGLFRVLSTITKVENMHKSGRNFEFYKFWIFLKVSYSHQIQTTLITQCLSAKERKNFIIQTRLLHSLTVYYRNLDDILLLVYKNYESLTMKDDRFVECLTITDETSLTEGKFCRPNVTEAM